MEDYGRRLKACAVKSLEKPWPNCWPTWSSKSLHIHHSQKGALFDAEDAIQQAQLDRTGGTKAICMIENISHEWAVQLGFSWQIPVEFFVEYLKAPDSDLSKRTFNEARLPGSSGGLQSTRRGVNWVTMRGVVDFGRRISDSTDEEVDDGSIRIEGQAGPDRFLQHTNVSCFKVHSNLDLFLVDRSSEARKLFYLDQDPHFPRQTMVRLGFVDSPGHMCFPHLRSPIDTAVLPLWNLLGDTYTAEGLMESLHGHGIDEFLYKASVFECQRHLNAALSRIKFISLQDKPHGEEEIMAQLRDARQALNRLYRCVEENRSHERAFERSQRSGTANDRMHFHQLAKEVRDLEQTVLRDMKVLMMTMSTRDVANSLELTEASHQQTRSMAILTWLMIVYAPLSFAAGVFGMNLAQLNDSKLPVSRFYIVAFSLLGGTVLIAVSCIYAKSLAEKHHCTLSQLLAPTRPLRRTKSFYRAAVEHIETAIMRTRTALGTEGSSSLSTSKLSKLEAGENL